MKYIIVFAVLLLSACGPTREPQRIDPTTNGDYQVNLLFQADGCGAYRFEDHGAYVYFVRCHGGTQQTMKSVCHMEGKVTVCLPSAVATIDGED